MEDPTTLPVATQVAIYILCAIAFVLLCTYSIILGKAKDMIASLFKGNSSRPKEPVPTLRSRSAGK